MEYTEEIQARLERGYTMAIYGTRENIHEQMTNDIKTLLEAINVIQCCKSDSELLVCDVDYLGNFTKGVKYLCKPYGLKHFEVEDDFGGLYKLHRKLFKKTKQQTNCLQRIADMKSKF